MDAHIEDRARFDLIRYANVWEDTEILCEALRPAPGKRILSIASAGDNALALAAAGAEVVAADLSPAQLACMRLKCAAIEQLPRDELLAFLGIGSCPDRQAIYEDLAGKLPDDDRRYWTSQRPAIARGIIHAGKFERFFHIFRRRVLPLIHSRRTVGQLLEEKPEPQREDFYRQRWDCRRWRWLFRIFFSRFVMGRLGRDPEFFRYVEGSVAERILARTRYALTALPTHENRYLEYILTGNFQRNLPWYLQADHLAQVRSGLPRLSLCCASVEEAAAQHAGAGFDGFNLSDLFEYLSPDICRRIYAQFLDCARPGARFAYWNMLAPRRLASEFPERVIARDEDAERWFRQDRAFFYNAFVVEEARA